MAPAKPEFSGRQQDERRTLLRIGFRGIVIVGQTAAIALLALGTHNVPAVAETRTAKRSQVFVERVESNRGWLGRYEVPDAGVAVVDTAKVVWSKRFGRETQQDIFEVASLSKTATALAALSLVEAGRIDLDAPVNTYLKRWKVTSERFNASKVTTRRLLNHTSGLPSAGAPESRPSIYPKIEDVLDGKLGMPRAEILTEPGSKFTYSNPGYGVLELLIEEVAKKSYPKAMRELVFEPLGMDETGFQDNEELAGRVVPGFRSAGRPAEKLLRFPRAAGGMLSTAPDIAQLLIAASESGRLLEAATLDEMREVDPEARGAFAMKEGGYALGVAQSALPSGDTFVANQGSHDGYNALFLGVPTARAGFVVLTNSNTGIGVELEMVLSWLKDVAGEQPKLASDVTTVRRAIRFGTGALFAICVLLFGGVLLGWRRGRRAGQGGST